MPDTMLPGIKVTPGSYITSNDQSYRAIMQGDGEGGGGARGGGARRGRGESILEGDNAGGW